MTTTRLVNISPMLKSLIAITSAERFRNSVELQRYLHDIGTRRFGGDPHRSVSEFLDTQDFLAEWRNDDDRNWLSEKARLDPTQPLMTVDEQSEHPTIIVDAVPHPVVGPIGWRLDGVSLRNINELVKTMKTDDSDSDNENTEKPERETSFSC